MGAWVARAVALGLLPVGLAVGLWRVERDQPLWLVRHERPPAARSAAASPPARLVLAVHYAWYGTPDGPTGRWRHWNHARLGMPENRLLGFHEGARGGHFRLQLLQRQLLLGVTLAQRDQLVLRALQVAACFLQVGVCGTQRSASLGVLLVLPSAECHGADRGDREHCDQDDLLEARFHFYPAVQR